MRKYELENYILNATFFLNLFLTIQVLFLYLFLNYSFEISLNKKGSRNAIIRN